jgi:hypothetical protein
MAIPEGYEVVSSIPEGYEAVGGSHVTMGADGLPTRTNTVVPPQKNFQDYTPQELFGDPLIGAGEAVLSLGSSALAGIPGAAVEAFGSKKAGREFMDKYTYHPRTERGEVYTDAVGQAVNAIGIPTLGHISAIPHGPKRIKGAPEAPKVEPKLAPKAKIPEGYEVVLDEHYAKAPEADAMQVEALEAALRRRGTPEGEGVIAVDKQGTAARPEVLAEVESARLRDQLQNYRQVEIDDTPSGYKAEQYGGGQEMLRYDENGMPIRADRSMEAQQLQNPLQRNLWGDEMVRQSEQEGIPLTEAIDSMPWAQRRGAINSQFGPKSQRGAINMDMLVPGFIEERMINNGIKLTYTGGSKPMVMAHDRHGKQIGQLTLLTDTAEPMPSSNMEAGGAHVIKEYRRKGVAQEMYKFVSELGSDIQASTSLLKDGRALWEGMEKKGIANHEWKIPAKQRGAVRPDMLVSKGLQEQMNKFGALMERLGGTKVSPYTSAEKVVVDALGERSYVPKGNVPVDIIKNALAEGKDGEPLWQNWQSGLNLSSEKTGSSVMRETGRWLNFGAKAGDRLVRNHVRPVEQTFASLNTKDLTAAMDLMRSEMFARERADISSLSPKAQKAYTELRAAFDKALVVTNDSLVKLGKKPIKAEEAYMASMWNGNYHLPVLDKAGKLRWYVKVETRAEANKAKQWLKDNHPDLDVDAAKIEYHPVNVGSRVPRDVMGAYQDMLQFFDGDIAAEMKRAMEHYTAEKGFTFQQHQKHFENKANVRGFLGDRPWLSGKENAKEQAKAQFQYLKEAFEWAPMQEALANVKEVIANPELNKQQPNNMELVKNYTAQTMGVSKNIARAAEQELQRFMTDIKGPLAKVTPNSLARFVHSTKTLTYLTQLGFSAGYAIATPLQAFILGPAWHLKTSGEGFKHNVFNTASKAMYDFSLGILGHEVKKMAPYDMPMSKLGKEAFAYMEDNGIISQNIFHENHGFGDYPPVHALKSVVGWTIAMPEKIARASTFMSFVHHLDASGKFTDSASLMRRAEELTNNVLTDFNREARPLLVDKLGQMGELGYTYKSAIFNQWNNLGVFARDAAKGKPGALLGALFMTGLLGGSNGMPGVNEVDALWGLTKDAASKAFPTLYPKLTGVGVKGSMLKHMAEFAANDKVRAVMGDKGTNFLKDTVNYGLPSAITGTQLASRFSSALGDIANPIENFTPVAQTIGNVAKLGGAILNPSETGLASAVHGVAPQALKGAMENQMDVFKTTKDKTGKQGYANPAKLSEHQTTYRRTPHEEALRYGGLRSLEESSTKDHRYMNNQESSRLKQAQDASMTKMFDAIVAKDKEAVKKYARAYYENNGSEGFERDLNQKLEGYMYTPEQRASIKAQSIAALKNVKRFRNLHYGR